MVIQCSCDEPVLCDDPWLLSSMAGGEDVTSPEELPHSALVWEGMSLGIGAND